MWDGYWYLLARFKATERRLKASDELTVQQIARSQELIRLSLQLLGKPDSELYQDETGEYKAASVGGLSETPSQDRPPRAR